MSSWSDTLQLGSGPSTRDNSDADHAQRQTRTYRQSPSSEQMGGGPARKSQPSSSLPRRVQGDSEQENAEKESNNSPDTTGSPMDHEITAQSSESDPELVKVSLRRPASTRDNDDGLAHLVYAKSKVYIHPSSYSRDNVPGWIAVTRRAKRDFLLSWIPESLLKDEDKERFIKLEIGAEGAITMEEMQDERGR